MDIFVLFLFALGAMGVLAICATEPARRTILEGMAITVLFGFSFIVAVVIYLTIETF